MRIQRDKSRKVKEFKAILKEIEIFLFFYLFQINIS
jgi:hypothetical protein